MTWTDCPACAPNGVECFEHGPEDLDLARALAGFFQGKAEPDAEQVAWFLSDASVLRAEAGSGPYTLARLDQGWHNEHAFVLNDLVVVLGEGGKDCPASPEVVAKLPEGSTITQKTGMADMNIRDLADALRDMAGNADRVAEYHDVAEMGSLRAEVVRLMAEAQRDADLVEELRKHVEIMGRQLDAIGRMRKAALVIEACANLVGRTGVRGFEIGFVNDDVPMEDAGWYAHASFQGARIQVQDHRSPSAAALALAEQILIGGACRCGKQVTLADRQDGCRWRLMGKRWEPGCDVPPVRVEGNRGDLNAMRRAIRERQP